MHYRLIEKIGEGGMGSVWKAVDSRLDRQVALKVLPDRVSSDPKALARFEREARAVAVLSHPHILAVHDVGHEDGVHYVVMELLEGETLRQRLVEGPLTLRFMTCLSRPWRCAVSSCSKKSAALGKRVFRPAWVAR